MWKFISKMMTLFSIWILIFHTEIWIYYVDCWNVKWCNDKLIKENTISVIWWCKTKWIFLLNLISNFYWFIYYNLKFKSFFFFPKITFCLPEEMWSGCKLDKLTRVKITRVHHLVQNQDLNFDHFCHVNHEFCRDMDGFGNVFWKNLAQFLSELYFFFLRHFYKDCMGPWAMVVATRAAPRYPVDDRNCPRPCCTKIELKNEISTQKSIL